MTTRRARRVDRHRFDASSIKQLDSGAWEVWGVATRVGVFDYFDPSSPGGVFREFRPTEEVMRQDSLGTLVGVPLTIDHPSDDVTVENHRELSHGTVLEVRQDGDLVKVKIRVSTAEAIAKIRDGLVELSCGYDAGIEVRSGTTPEGKRFDAIQREIRYNHLALVERARAGRVARLHLDSATAWGHAANARRYSRVDSGAAPALGSFRIQSAGPHEIKPMKTKIRINDSSYEISAFALPGLMLAAESRDDQIETGKITIEGEDGATELVLPKAMIDEVLSMVGGAPAPAPAADPAPEPELPESEIGDQLGEEPPVPVADQFGEEKRGDAEAKINAMRKRMDREIRERASIERKACRVLDSGYDFAGASSVTVMADAVAAVRKDRADAAKALATAAEGGDARAHGRLDEMFGAAIEAHVSRNDAQDLQPVPEPSDTTGDRRVDAEGIPVIDSLTAARIEMNARSEQRKASGDE